MNRVNIYSLYNFVSPFFIIITSEGIYYSAVKVASAFLFLLRASTIVAAAYLG